MSNIAQESPNLARYGHGFAAVGESLFIMGGQSLRPNAPSFSRYIGKTGMKSVSTCRFHASDGKYCKILKERIVLFKRYHFIVGGYGLNNHAGFIAPWLVKCCSFTTERSASLFLVSI